MKCTFKFLFLLAIFFSCKRDTNNNSIGFKHQRFSFELPQNCITVYDENKHTYYGQIKCGQFIIDFDYGYCNYSSFEVNSREEYLRQNLWLTEAISQFMPKNKEVSTSSILKQMKILSVDKNKMVANFEYDGKIFSHRIKIPSFLENKVETVDTTDGVITKIIYDLNDLTKITCYKINTLKYDERMLCPESLIVWLKSKNGIDTSFGFTFIDKIQFPLPADPPAVRHKEK